MALLGISGDPVLCEGKAFRCGEMAAMAGEEEKDCVADEARLLTAYSVVRAGRALNMVVVVAALCAQSVESIDRSQDGCVPICESSRRWTRFILEKKRKTVIGHRLSRHRLHARLGQVRPTAGKPFGC